MDNFYGQKRAIGTRKEQQDSYGFLGLGDVDDEFIKHGGRLSIVCDGMGGLQNGREASECAVKAFREAYKAKTARESVPDALDRAVRYANDQVLAIAERFGQVGNCGSTLVAAVLRDNFLYWISVGDSHIYFCRDEKVYLLNKEHIYAHKLDAGVLRGMISEEDARAHPDRDALTSYIGIPQLVEIDSGSLERLSPGEGVMLCSDGLCKVLSDEEMSDAFDPDPQRWADNLVEATLGKRRQHQDNITVTILLREAAAVPVKKRKNKRKWTKKPEFFFMAAACLLLLFAVLSIVGDRPDRPRSVPADTPSVTSEDNKSNADTPSVTPDSVTPEDNKSNADTKPVSEDQRENNVKNEKPNIERIENLPDLSREG
jgi:protein phosphatase